MNPSEESAFDEQLRQRLADIASPKPLPAGGIADVRARLAAAGPAAPVPRPVPATRVRPFAGGMAAGILLMLTGWWGTRQLTEPARVTATHPVTTVVSPVTTSALPITTVVSPIKNNELPIKSNAQLKSNAQPIATNALPIKSNVSAITTNASPITTVAHPLAASDSARSVTPPADVTPGLALSPRWTRAIALDTALRHALARPTTDTSRAARQAHRARLHELVGAQVAALATLQASFDSLKAALPEAPPLLAAAAATDSVAPPAEAWRQLPPARSPWALLAMLETTPSWSTLPVRNPTDDNERTQASLSQSVQLQRQVGNRWLVRAGLGQLATQSQVRRTSERTGQTTVHDSSEVTDITVRQTQTTSQIVHVIDSVALLEPVVNLSGQIIGYDTTWVSITETQTATITNHDTLRTTRIEHSTHTEQWREQRQQLFRPTYRFWTLPVAVQYQLLRRNRWAVGLNAGAQITVFRGGTRPVWTGDDYVMQRVGSREGPYRPVSLSVSAGLEAAYRVSPRLTALVAPTMRWWAVQPGQDATTRIQPLLPALQLGLTYGF